MSAEAVRSSESTNNPGNTWAEAEIDYGQKMFYTVKMGIPSWQGRTKLYAFIESKQTDPAGASIVVPLVSRGVMDKLDFKYTKIFDRFTSLNQASLGIRESSDIVTKVLTLLNLDHKNLRPFKLSEAWESYLHGHFTSSLIIYGHALSCREIISFRAVPYVPQARSQMLAKRIGQIHDWQITPIPADKYATVNHED